MRTKFNEDEIDIISVKETELRNKEEELYKREEEIKLREHEFNKKLIELKYKEEKLIKQEDYLKKLIETTQRKKEECEVYLGDEIDSKLQDEEDNDEVDKLLRDEEKETEDDDDEVSYKSKDKGFTDDQAKSRFSFRKGAYQILKIQKKPMSALEILHYGISNSIFNLNSKK